MKVVFISDLQAHKWKQYPETNEEGVNLRILDVTNEMDRIRKLSIRNKVDTLVVLGDIFEARNELHISVLNNVYYALKGFADAGIRVVLLVGNHDRTGVGREHALEVFKPFCEVVDKPTTLHTPQGDILAIPFYPNARTVVRAIEHFTTPRTKLICAHVAVQTLKLPNGQLWGQGISLSSIPSHVKAIFGHYHRFTELVPGRVYYLGSMIQVDQSDRSFDKYFGVYDSDTDELSFHQTRGPRFVAVDVPNTDDKYFQEIRHLTEGNFVTVKSVPSGFLDYDSIRQSLLKLGARHVELDTHLPITPPPLDLISQASGTNHEEIIRHYVEEADTDLDKEEVIEVGTEIVQEAQDLVETGVEQSPDTHQIITQVVEVN